MLSPTNICRNLSLVIVFAFIGFGITACLSNSRDPQYGAYPNHTEVRDYYLGDKATADPELERELNYGWDIGP